MASQVSWLTVWLDRLHSPGHSYDSKWPQFAMDQLEQTQEIGKKERLVVKSLIRPLVDWSLSRAFFQVSQKEPKKDGWKWVCAKLKIRIFGQNLIKYLLLIDASNSASDWETKKKLTNCILWEYTNILLWKDRSRRPLSQRQANVI